MAGTREGGLKAVKTNKKRYNEDFYRTTGRKGGKTSKGGGFSANPTAALEASIKGLEKRGHKVRPETRAKLAALKAAQAELETEVQKDSLAATYGSLEAEEASETPRTIVVQKEVPGWYYGVWIIGSSVAVFVAFWLGTVAYR